MGINLPFFGDSTSSPRPERGMRQTASGRKPKALGESTESKLIWKPQTLTVVDLETAQKLLRLVDMLEEDDDVQSVVHNFDIPEDVAALL